MVPILAIKKIREDIEVFELSFSFDSDTIQKVKEIPGRRYFPDQRVWIVPVNQATIEKFGSLFPPGILSIRETIQELKPAIPMENLHRPERWEVDKVRKKLILKGYSQSTIHTYTSFLRRFFEFHKDRSPDNLNLNHIEEFLLFLIQEKRVARSTHNQAINAIKFYFEQILGNPRISIQIERPRKEKKLPVVLSEEEIMNIFKAIKNFKHRVMIMLLYSSGLRRAELLNLKPGDVDIYRKELKVVGGKGLKDRSTVLSETLIPDLITYMEVHQPKFFLFEGQNGGKYSESSIRMILKRAVGASQIRKQVTLHTLRHSFATHLLEHGTPTRYIQEFLGHSSPLTTEIYTRITDKGRKKIKSPLDAIAKNVRDEI